MLVDSTRLCRLHCDDGNDNFLMELYEKEVANFPNAGIAECVDNASDSYDKMILDAEEYMEDARLQDFVMTSLTVHNTLISEQVSCFSEEEMDA